MNSCILMAQIIQDPELRYTSENQTPLTQMLVQFASVKAEESPSTLKVVGWGEYLANEIKANYSTGDRVVIEGSLRMNVIERPEGFKEKRAELNVSRIHKLGTDDHFEPQVMGSERTFQQTPEPSRPQTIGALSVGELNSPRVAPHDKVVSMEQHRMSSSVSSPNNTGQDFAYTSTEQNTEQSFDSSFGSSSPQNPTSGSPSHQQDLDDIPF
ncbi:MULTISPECIES: single-stranded DNA-binding protein [unclassified Moorena]|uniref:single-stranded DNA-binding protein n=1 Tax=unclassified Moorena TaxID=2683338 RepID=UPI0013BAE07D|nr:MULTISPECIES: single-stranded DNA-binding protein [unclassified Moorena]NEP31708.1 single-stranded DNA-binding protein [Moorena sp. SIO3B2]NEQ05217.1 single-stranded DNA-binding protein [Moorena sp. SIO4E2]NEQ17092.1 single-stranded DNA-binding protein [Moorena sp. SIO3E2]NES45606.1 single-stranded DNA-binding protein [Moorena sp. SIO2C4]